MKTLVSCLTLLISVFAFQANAKVPNFAKLKETRSTPEARAKAGAIFYESLEALKSVPRTENGQARRLVNEARANELAKYFESPGLKESAPEVAKAFYEAKMEEVPASNRALALRLLMQSAKSYTAKVELESTVGREIADNPKSELAKMIDVTEVLATDVAVYVVTNKSVNVEQVKAMINIAKGITQKMLNEGDAVAVNARFLETMNEFLPKDMKLVTLEDLIAWCKKLLG